MQDSSDATQQLIEQLRARAHRERAARKEAEHLLEEKSRELYVVNESLRELTASLERQVDERTSQLSEALERARAATEAKSNFLATMSHEIRTPLNGMLGMTQVLELGSLDPEQRKYVSLIRRSGGTLLELLNDILDFSRIESGVLELENEPFSLRAFIADVEAFNRPLLHESGLGFSVSIDPKVPDALRGDVARLRQVLLNLLSNARKFTPQGSVTLDVGLTALAQQTVGIRISVSDSGVGIAPENHAKIFDAFAQADASTSRVYGGTGLGLAICARLVAAMGGIIRVESEVGNGACFSVELSLVRVESGIGAGQSMHGRTVVETVPDIGVLVVDDNELNCVVLTEMLRQIGIESDVVHDGLAALSALNGRRYGMILMDAHMPGMNGIEATRAIRSLPLPAQPWIIAVTADASSHNRNSCAAAGMDGLLVKPLQFTELQATMKRHAHERPASGAAAP